MSLSLPSSASAARWTAYAALALSTLACGTRDPRAVDHVTPELETVVRGNNEFAFALYKEAAKKPGNVFFSPMSISAAFAMTYAGARNETATEMRSVLRIQGEEATYHAEFGALLRDLGGDHARGYRLSIANRLFGSDRYAFAAPFLTLTETEYGAPLELVDFTTGEGAGPINEWVAQQTDGQIDQLFEPKGLEPDTVLVLANAIHFDADWKEPFNSLGTETQPFFTRSGEPVQTSLMQGGGVDRYVLSEEVAVVARAYADDELEMVLVIPQGEHQLAELEAKLDDAWFDARMSEAKERDAELAMPRFELQASLPLKAHLTHMGMQLPFDLRADLSGMTASGARELFVSMVAHQASIRVDERGTEASAATGVVAVPTSTHPFFRADRPFFFVIRDRLTSSILFMGRMEDPSLATVAAE